MNRWCRILPRSARHCLKTSVNGPLAEIKNASFLGNSPVPALLETQTGCKQTTFQTVLRSFILAKLRLIAILVMGSVWVFYVISTFEQRTCSMGGYVMSICHYRISPTLPEEN